MSRWTDDFLQSMRQEMDPLADQTVKALFEDQGLGVVRSFHGDLVDDDGKPKAGLPDAMVHYLNETAKAPPFPVDQAKLVKAQRIMNSHGPLTFIVLGCASLPECYVDWRGMPVLFLTQRLNVDIRRRVIETCLYVASVLSTDGFTPTGHGLDATRKVRLMHAANRYMILNSSNEEIMAGLPEGIRDAYKDHGWEESMGLPVNQEDLGYTLQTFAWVMVRGMQDLGLELEEDEKDAIIHCWNIAGYYLGVDPRLMPENATEAEELFKQMKARLAGHSAEGESLTAALIDFVDENFIEKLFDEKLAEKVDATPPMLMRYLCGDETGDMLGLPVPTEHERKHGRRWLAAFRTVVKLREARYDHLPFLRGVSNRIFQKLAIGRWSHKAGPEAFQIPDQLAGHWHIVKMPD